MHSRCFSKTHLYVDEAVLSDILTTLGWWTLMQHHGTPTRLLDWSSSILVAAYFAVSSDPECDGALWIVQKKTLVDVVNAACGPSPFPRSEKVIQERFCTAGACPAIHFFDKVRPHQRMAAQEGSFSVCENVLTDHDAIVRVPTPGQVTKLLRKYVIPASLKRSFWQRLTKEGTSASKLFPGLDGFARSIGEELVHNAFTATG